MCVFVFSTFEHNCMQHNSSQHSFNHDGDHIVRIGIGLCKAHPIKMAYGKKCVAVTKDALLDYCMVKWEM